MQIQTFTELFISDLKKIYDAEKQLTLALPGIANSAVSEELKNIIMEHQQETIDHVARLEEVANMIELDLSGETNKIMTHILQEGKETVDSLASKELMDLAITGACTKVEHFEIACYETLLTIVKQMENTEIEQKLADNLEEEQAAARKLAFYSQGGLPRVVAKVI